MSYTKQQVKDWINHTSNGHKHTTEAKKAISQAKQGKNNPKYQGAYYVIGRKFYSLRKAANHAAMPLMTFYRLAKSGKNPDYKFVADPDKVL